VQGSFAYVGHLSGSWLLHVSGGLSDLARVGDSGYPIPSNFSHPVGVEFFQGFFDNRIGELVRVPLGIRSVTAKGAVGLHFPEPSGLFPFRPEQNAKMTVLYQSRLARRALG
jgi:hypothetical protein